MSEQMQMEEEDMGFLDMAGGPPEPSMMPQTDPLQEMGLQQVQSVMSQVMSRFQGGMEEVEELIEADKQDIKNFKENQGEYDNIEDNLEIQANPDEDPTNFIASSVPGSSLTGDLENQDKGTLGKFAWETPPEIEGVEEAFQFVSENKNQSPNRENAMKLLYAGVPAEAIARTTSFKGFVEGLWTPDISELLVIPLMLDLVADAQEEGFTARIFNDFEDDEVSEDTVLDIMEELKPEEFSQIRQEADMLKRMPDEMEMDLEPEPMMGSFLDMEEEI
tara:strand:+ start:1528 stop:2355 length:828 start_codon:yes stop_codon:yes gene_type:complete